MSFVDRCLVFLRWKMLIAVTTAAFAALSVVLALLLPKSYQSTASIFPPEEESFSLSTLSSLVSATTLGGGSQSSLPIWATPSDVYAAVLRSRTVREEVVRRHDLTRVYHADDMDRALRALDHHVTIKVGAEGVVQIRVLDHDPARAAAIANSMVEILDKVNREKRNTSARQARIFLEGRLQQNRSDMARAEQQLRAIQESSGVMIPEDQFKSVMDVTTEVQVQLLLKEVDLAVLRTQVGPEHPDREAMQREVDLLRRRMKELELGQEGAGGSGGLQADAMTPGGSQAGPPVSSGLNLSGPSEGLDLPLRKYPAVQLAYLRALREVTVQETIYQFLTEEYERYRIQENRDTPTVQVLDSAVPATYKARPIRWLICMSLTLAGLLISLGLAALVESLRRMRGEAPDRFERVRLLARELHLERALERL